MQSTRLLILLMSLLPLMSIGQKKAVTLDEIYGKNAGVFSQRSVSGVNWMKAGGYYTTLEPGKVVKYNSSTGNAEEVLFDQNLQVVEGTTDQKLQIEGYELSGDESKLLLLTQASKQTIISTIALLKNCPICQQKGNNSTQLFLLMVLK